ncbi:CLUMA_CG008947, isoform A [Clunio marinus]|uniref:CLUMA_CG008947, isoform A n=1 Tax=Clunio marinus TaxID=568069 RepID=A0A1J1I937_9DIPT|nr:CLUMA_CG008947, isoform A [Clunio marinus]
MMLIPSAPKNQKGEQKIPKFISFDLISLSKQVGFNIKADDKSHSKKKEKKQFLMNETFRAVFLCDLNLNLLDIFPLSFGQFQSTKPIGIKMNSIKCIIDYDLEN